MIGSGLSLEVCKRTCSDRIEVEKRTKDRPRFFVGEIRRDVATTMTKFGWIFGQKLALEDPKLLPC